jgi:hypothetical protein
LGLGPTNSTRQPPSQLYIVDIPEWLRGVSESERRPTQLPTAKDALASTSKAAIEHGGGHIVCVCVCLVFFLLFLSFGRDAITVLRTIVLPEGAIGLGRRATSHQTAGWPRGPRRQGGNVCPTAGVYIERCGRW